LLLLSRLGLRAGEVARLGLDDIDWRAGQIAVRGKGASRRLGVGGSRAIALVAVHIIANPDKLRVAARQGAEMSPSGGAPGS